MIRVAAAGKRLESELPSAAGFMLPIKSCKITVKKSHSITTFTPRLQCSIFRIMDCQKTEKERNCMFSLPMT